MFLPVLLGDTAVLHRGTPLYGQPAWWGDEEAEGQQQQQQQQQGRSEEKNSERKREKAEAEASYFEIPSKDSSSAPKVCGEPSSRDQDDGPCAAAEPLHGHASFTIEFDPGASGKVTVKDRVAKAGTETRPRPKRSVGEELSPLQTAMVAAEVKVADWLAQNELPLTLKEASAEDDGESVKSDVPVQLRSLKGSKHEDGTQSDSENALGEQRRAAALDERSWGLWGDARTKIREGRANVPEGLFAEEDSPARRRKPSSSKVAKELVERRRGSAPVQQNRRDDYSDRGTYTVELENGDREDDEARRLIDKVKICVEQTCLLAEGLLFQALSEELVVGGPRWVSQWATLAASHVRTDPEGSGGENQVLLTDDRDPGHAGETTSLGCRSSSGHAERKRRTLPQPPGEHLLLGRRTLGGGPLTELGEKQDTELQEKESQEERVARGKGQPGRGSGAVGSHSSSPSRSSPAKSQDSGGGRSAHSGMLANLPPRPLTSGEKRMEEALRRRKEEDKARESSGKSLLRQESFTVERQTSNIPIELIPRIDGSSAYRTQSKEPGIDCTALQKDSEAVAAFLETIVSDQGDPPSQSIEGSMSPESDVDTTSTVSQAEGARKVVQKRRPLTGQQKERTVVCSSNKGSSGGREAQDRKIKSKAPAPQQAGRPWTSLDLTDDDVNSNSLLSDPQPTSTQQPRGLVPRAQTGTSTASTKSSRAKMMQPPPSSGTNKATNAPKPRPTRTSLLRRNRLGDSSDTEPADLDRMSVASEASTASSTSRTGMAKRGMSRIEALAQPRRPRVGSPSAQSDSEATVTRGRGLGTRGLASEYAFKHGPRGSSLSSVSGPRARANSVSKLPDKSKGGSSFAPVTHPSGTRWRRLPMDYASTSEDEYGSNRHTSKQGPIPSTRVAQSSGSAPATPNPAGMAALRQNSRDQDEYMRDWTTHSEEIARISQDLAKDLAMLAREIHDVAGEIDSVKALFEDSLDGGGSVELRQRGLGAPRSRSIRRQTWNRDDALLDGLLLASVTQLSSRIRQSVDKTTCKIRILFKDKDRKWEDIESKLQEEHESLLLKSSSKVMHDSLIDMMVDPDGTLDALSNLGLTSPLADQRAGPGAQMGASTLEPEAASSNTALKGLFKHPLALKMHVLINIIYLLWGSAKLGVSVDDQSTKQGK
uniref:Centrosomal protein 170Ab n=1 Tax=Oryzias latipes TaxID=8090 RepID=H2MD38_ORYLA